jgi:hypothetical protein
VRGTQHVEDPVQTLLVDHVSDPDQVQVARGNADHEVLLCNDAEHEVLLVLALDLPCLDVLDDCCAVIWVNNRFADGKCHVLVPLPR